MPKGDQRVGSPSIPAEASAAMAASRSALDAVDPEIERGRIEQSRKFRHEAVAQEIPEKSGRPVRAFDLDLLRHIRMVERMAFQLVRQLDLAGGKLRGREPAAAEQLVQMVGGPPLGQDLVGDQQVLLLIGKPPAWVNHQRSRAWRRNTP